MGNAEFFEKNNILFMSEETLRWVKDHPNEELKISDSGHVLTFKKIDGTIYVLDFSEVEN